MKRDNSGLADEFVEEVDKVDVLVFIRAEGDRFARGLHGSILARRDRDAEPGCDREARWVTFGHKVAENRKVLHRALGPSGSYREWAEIHIQVCLLHP